MPAEKPVLIIAEAANPEWVSVPLVGWSHSAAIAALTPAHIVTQVRNRDAFLRAGLREHEDFTAIDSEHVARKLWRLSERLRGNSGVGWTTDTAIASLGYYFFEHLVWQKFRSPIRSGKYRIVHRLTPLTPTAPSILARKCRRAEVPFIWGPINGGLPWPGEFEDARRREREWLSYLRSVYKLLPGYRSTRSDAAAIIVGSKATYTQVPARFSDKCIYIPENAIHPDRFPQPPEKNWALPLRIAFVGRLVPYKGAHLLIEALAPLARDGHVVLDVIGDGPEKPALIERARNLQIQDYVSFSGWIDHAQVHHRLARAHLLGFPSIREFGGGVALEAMALGVVPIVVDYGGPAELVTEDTGFKVPLGAPADIIEALRAALRKIVDDPADLPRYADRARERVMSLFTWEQKARQTIEVYRWVCGERATKPDFGIPLDRPADQPGRYSTIDQFTSPN